MKWFGGRTAAAIGLLATLALWWGLAAQGGPAAGLAQTHTTELSLAIGNPQASAFFAATNVPSPVEESGAQSAAPLPEGGHVSPMTWVFLLALPLAGGGLLLWRRNLRNRH